MKVFILGLMAFWALPLFAEPMFDVHVHYDASHQPNWAVDRVMDTLTENRVQFAVVTSIPPELVLELQRVNDAMFVPMLGVYQKPKDKQYWHWNKDLVANLERNLKRHSWSAIGELHLFAQHKNSPVFRAILELADEYQLPLLLHADPAVIDKAYELFPDLTIIWAHAGKYPFPELLTDYLQRYPTLMIELSMRNERIAPDGELGTQWELLFYEYPERFMVGVDTFSKNRWNEYGQVNSTTRNWLSQLPEGIAQKMMMTNAKRVFNRNKP